MSWCIDAPRPSAETAEGAIGMWQQADGPAAFLTFDMGFVDPVTALLVAMVAAEFLDSIAAESAR